VGFKANVDIWLHHICYTADFGGLPQIVCGRLAAPDGFAESLQRGINPILDPVQAGDLFPYFA
jgi:hypothetical protein